MIFLERLVVGALCVLVMVAVSRGEGERRGVDRTVRVTVRVEGENISGKIVSWDDARVWIEVRGGGEREAAWSDLGAKRAYDVRRRVMAEDDWSAWARVGALMLELDDERLADRAFGIAEKKNKDAKQTVLRMRRAHERGEDLYSVLEDGENTPGSGETQKSEPAKKKEGERTEKTGGGRDGPDESEAVRGVRQWATLSEAQHTEETLRLRRIAKGMLVMGDFEIEAIETEHFLLYSDLASSETKKWAGKLDTMYQTLLATLDIPEGTRLFRGRCVVFIFKEREDFLGFESSVFGYNARWAGGVCHQRNEDVFICFFKGGRADQDFQSVLIHEAVHGFMYRYRSSGRLPTWANEGLADYVAGYLTERSTEPQRHWQHARNFINSGGDTGVIMTQRYGGQGDYKWPSDDSYPVSHMLVRFMLKHRAPAFKAWIDDVKAGRDWEEAMAARFGVSKDVLAEGFGKEMRSERRYTRLR